ncbi:hypothetical protein Tco_1037821 [Tanacetum coccineum]
MVGSLMYLTASRPDLVFDVCMCAKYQASPTKKHLEALKRVFRVLFARINTMADMNMPTNDVPAEKIAPPTRTDDQILPSSKWVPIGKSNCILDVQNCQLDEQWFNLHKDILGDALDITPSNDNNPFVAPPLSDTVIENVNTLGYPCTLRNMSAMFVNALYQPWRAILKNLATASRGKKKTAHLLILNVRYVGKDGKEIFGMPIPDALLTDAIKSPPYYNSYLEHVTKYQRYLNEEHDKADDKSPKPASSQPPKPTPTPTESSKKD